MRVVAQAPGRCCDLLAHHVALGGATAAHLGHLLGAGRARALVARARALVAAGQHVAARGTTRRDGLAAVGAPSDGHATARARADALRIARARRDARADVACFAAHVVPTRKGLSAWLVACPRGRQAIGIRGACAATHRAGVSSAVAGRVVELDVTRRTWPCMTQARTHVPSTRELAAADSAARHGSARHCLSEGKMRALAQRSAQLRAAQLEVWRTAAVASDTHARSARRARARVADVRTAAVPRTATRAAPAAAVRHAAAAWLRRAPAPTQVLARNVLPRNLTPGAPPVPARKAHLLVLVHRVALFHLRHATLRPRPHA